ncbi:chromosome segregation ATPase [Alkalihalobacillus xiaoxiensis]|uniref:Chromosome segregation ATPase n=1 Tax=Shouchella xiaoxiensis TaxID=766895 RepID=A0ABS2SSJ4_9BACI|nr:hypothetical protein [Shouchella xiaoxiensis]MBM7837971.1 chromosome segregation ATPase [Shouchella xiaoxiensis]
MFEELRQRQLKIGEKKRLQEKWLKHRDDSKMKLEEFEIKANELKSVLEDEKKGLSQLESLSFRNVLVTISGRKLERVDEHTQKIASAKLKYDENRQTIDDLQMEISRYDEEIAKIGNLEKQLEGIFLEKRELIKIERKEVHAELLLLTDEQTRLELQENELKEAIAAGENAKSALSITLDALDSAKGWSTWDMFGGGVISTAIKHSHLDDAEKHVHRAQRALRHFEDELKDVNQFTDHTIAIGGFMTFADYFFDGFVVDWMVHGKITDSIKQVSNTKQAVGELVDRLKIQGNETKNKISSLNNQYHERIRTLQ